MLQKILQPRDSGSRDEREEASIRGQENVPRHPQKQISLPGLALRSAPASSGQQHCVRGEGQQSPRRGQRSEDCDVTNHLSDPLKVFSTFVVCWAPFFVLNLVAGLCSGGSIPDFMFEMALWLG